MLSTKPIKIDTSFYLDNKMTLPMRELRLDVQGLRAVAISMVVLYHVWPNKYPAGFFGVDVFFIISGFLMCSFMRRFPTITLRNSVEFYFKRLKRLVPFYLSVITFVLLISTMAIDRYTYSILFIDGLSASLFFSNLPALHRITYSQVIGKSVIFLNTWSLSNEMQFYAIVPLIVLMSNLFVNKFNEKWQKFARQFFNLSLAILSFAYQSEWLVDVQARYCLLAVRLWQFLIGFMAYELRQHLIENKKIWEVLKTTRFQHLLHDGTLILLFLCGTFNVLPGDTDQSLRFIVSLLTFNLIVFGDSSLKFSWLICDLSVWLGEISYALYLVHWPLLIAHQQYWLYLYKPYLPLSIGLPLICLFLLISFLLNNLDKFLNRSISNWSQLCKLMAIFYLIIFANLIHLKFNALHDEEPKIANREEANRFLDEIWVNRYNQLNQTQIIDYNFKLLGITNELRCPKVNNHPFFKKWTVKTNEEGFQQFKGTGKKNIVLFGNSHARYAANGISRILHDLYDEFSTVTIEGCAPFTHDMQPAWSKTGYQQQCQEFMENFPKALARWPKPIDVVILLFGYADGSPDNEIYVNEIDLDRNFQFMQQFYRNSSFYAREILIYSTINPYFKETPRSTIVKWKRGHLDAELPMESLKEQLKYRPNIQRRLNSIKCPRCIKFDPLQLWCRQYGGQVCTTYDENGLITFVDEQHFSAFGAIQYANEIRKLYEKHVPQFN